MIQTIIVDDEFLVRHAVKEAVDWHELGFEICGEAADGIEALELVAEIHPELIILDINIPLLDGIRVSEEISKKYPYMKIIILTGYDSFDYIQKCMRLGILNYVVKPIEKEELENALIGAKREILTQKNTEKFSKMFREQLTGDTGDLTADFSDQYMNLQLAHPSDSSYIAILEIDYFKKKHRTEGEQILALKSVSLLINEFKDIHHVNIIHRLYKNSLCLALFIAEDRSVYEVIKQLQQYILDNLNLSVSIGISARLQENGDITKQISEAEKALAMKFSKGIGQVYDYVNTIGHSIRPDEPLDAKVIYNYLRQLDMDKINAYIHSTITGVNSIGLQKDWFYLISADLVTCAVNYAMEVGINLMELFGDEQVYLSHIERCETADELELWLISLFNNIISFSKNSHMAKGDKTVRLACEYIAANYQDKRLSLSTVSSHLCFTSNYLSKIFKREMSMTITDYIIQVRMTLAKQKIDNGEVLKIINLANLVGYNDPFYFSKIFKKVFGISPSKYIEQRILSQDQKPGLPIRHAARNEKIR